MGIRCFRHQESLSGHTYSRSNRRKWVGSYPSVLVISFASYCDLFVGLQSICPFGFKYLLDIHASSPPVHLHAACKHSCSSNLLDVQMTDCAMQKHGRSEYIKQNTPWDRSLSATSHIFLFIGSTHNLHQSTSLWNTISPHLLVMPFNSLSGLMWQVMGQELQKSHGLFKTAIREFFYTNTLGMWV